MKSIIIVALALAAVAVAAPPVDQKDVTVLRSTFEQQPEGNYELDIETSDGSVRKETGQLKEALDEENKPHSVISVRGTYSYVNPEGKTETVNYYADETGFHAEGDSIPKAAVARR